MIRFPCPSCERVVEVSDDDAGLPMSCPTCGKRVAVPGSARPKPEPRDESPEKVVTIKDCPECGKALEVPEEDVGRRVSCPRCGESFVARLPAKRRRDEEEDDRPRKKGRNEKYCVECGAVVHRKDEYCPECDAAQPKDRDPTLSDANSKKIAAGICALLIGGLGVHKFILGYTTAGVIMLLVTFLTCGIGGIVMHVISLIEGIMYLTRSDEEFHRTYLVGKKEWF